MFGQKLQALTPAKIILGGFFLLILTGSLLLCLPISSKTGQVTPFINAFFTATSATCVTGLIVYDTYSYWSLFGQSVILILIQIGGMGVVTLAIAVTILSGRKISLKQRYVMQESISAPQVGGIIRMAGFIVRATIFFELAGAAVLAFQFIPQMGLAKGLWFSLFHSVSAFCNAGFDLMGGTSGSFSSITSFTGNPIINLPIMCLIILGGIGFFVWDDIKTHRLRFSHYHLQTKIVLTVTALLIAVPAVFLFFFEFSRDCWKDFSMSERFLASLFQAVTPRTAGFNSVDLTKLSESSQLLMVLLMVIGGSPGSTAGGIKTTTLAVSLLCVRSAFRSQEGIQCFGRRIPQDILRNAVAILSMYLVLLFSCAFLLTWLEQTTMMESLFESASAVATVGLTLGITSELGVLSKLLLILLMYIGRVGGLTMLYALTNGRKPAALLPQERVTVG